MPLMQSSEIEDCTLPWTFAPNSFDYVHLRFLVGSIDDWHELLRNAYHCCKPGGYVETFEPSAQIISDDGTVPETSALGQWGKFYVEGGRKIGRTFLVYEDDVQKKAVEAAGFVDIEEREFKVSVYHCQAYTPFPTRRGIARN